MAAFRELQSEPDPPLDELLLAVAAEFRTVDRRAALERIDRIADRVGAVTGDPYVDLAALTRAIAVPARFRRIFEAYDDRHPDPSIGMFDLALRHHAGHPVLQGALYLEVARRVGIPLVAVGPHNHLVFGHVGTEEMILLDPNVSGAPICGVGAHVDTPRWSAARAAIRVLGTIQRTYYRRYDLTRSIRAAEMRTFLPCSPAEHARHVIELRALRALLN